MSEIDISDAQHSHRQLAITIIEEVIEVREGRIDGEDYYLLEDKLTEIIYRHFSGRCADG